ncbi:MAG TPA: ABC transporter ATP-binding protein [Saprospiraceae bacterium]|nr:ABC transporter ATP-binding protein [Saprospiraceae bacterium]HMQ82299.1 ABC transporter ATP-binding protein [Saprospiraceae bacterium]
MKANLFKRFFSFVYPYRWWELVLFLLIILSTLSSLASPYVLKLIIDNIIPSKDYQALINILLMLGGIYIFRFFVSIAIDYIHTWLSNHIVIDIKKKIFQNLTYKPYRYFDQNNTGDLIQKANNEVDKVKHFLTNSIIRALTNMVTLVGLVVMLCWLSYKLFLVSFLIIPCFIWLNKSLSKHIKKAVEKSSKQEGEIYNFLFDRISKIKLIKLYNNHQLELNRLNDEQHKLFQHYLHAAMYSSSSRNGSIFLIALGPLIAFAYGGYQVIIGTLTVGSLVAFIQYLNRVYGPVQDLMYLFVDYVRIQVSMNRIADLIDDNSPKPSERHPIPAIKNIFLEDLHFQYDGKPLLKGINIKLERGKKYALVGPSGSGKSTLVKLLSLCYDWNQGAMRLNDKQCLSKIDSITWADKVTVVSQEVLILNDTIDRNIRYGNLQADDEAVWTALEMAALRDMVEQLPDQLNTMIGSGLQSLNPSGGQQQQIALARAFIRPSEVLILDEALSAIDSHREQIILRNIFNHFQNSIIVSISHRLSSVKDFDEIIYLDQGRILERGNHESLTAQENHYHALFHRQFNTETICK